MTVGSTEEARSVPDSFFPDVDSLKTSSFDDTKPRFVPFDSQVAGHDGVLSDENGYIIIKPCTDVEVAWYERCVEEQSPLIDCMPAFMGVLELKTPETLASIAPEAAQQLQLQQQQQKQQQPPRPRAGSAADPLAYSPPQASHERAVVLENLAYGYTKPCIVDIKLGRVLASPDAPKAKRDRLAAVAARTTSGSLGVRIAGMKVWRSTRQAYSKYERDWGKNLDQDSIYTEGVVEFFSADLRMSQKQMIASRMMRDIQGCIDALEEVECRIYSPSLLLVYEGDQTALNHAIEDEGRQLIEEELGHGLHPEEIELGVSAQSFTPARSPEIEHNLASLHHETSTESDSSLPVGALKLPMTATPYSPVGSEGKSLSSSSRGSCNPPAARPQLPTPHPSTMSVPVARSKHSSASTTHRPTDHVDSVDDGNDDDDDDSETSKATEFYSCRLIDFAHATFTPGQGVDHNTLDGLRAAKRLLRRFVSG